MKDFIEGVRNRDEFRTLQSECRFHSIDSIELQGAGERPCTIDGMLVGSPSPAEGGGLENRCVHWARESLRPQPGVAHPSPEPSLWPRLLPGYRRIPVVANELDHG